MALIELFHRHGRTGAAVLKGVADFGARSVVHTASVPPLSADLPLVIEVVDSPVHLDTVLPEVDAMMDGGLITMETVRVIRYDPARLTAPRPHEGRRP
jgi:hypothetical protein